MCCCPICEAVQLRLLFIGLQVARLTGILAVAFAPLMLIIHGASLQLKGIPANQALNRSFALLALSFWHSAAFGHKDHGCINNKMCSSHGLGLSM